MMKQRKWLINTDRAKENLNFSYGGPSQGQASDTKQRIKALRQGRHWVWGLAHRRVIK